MLLGRGVQIYGCSPAAPPSAGGLAPSSEPGFAWQLKAPDAILTDAAGRRVGHHFAGPSWQADDGSTIVGEPLVASPAPKPGDVAWLVLRVKSHTGEGAFANVAYVVRSMTEGGAAPATGCDAAHAGAEARIDYSAVYTLFPAAPKP